MILKQPFYLFILMLFYTAMATGQGKKESFLPENTGLGGSGIYNFQTKGWGIGARAEVPYKSFSIVPELSYYFWFNQIHEVFFSLGAHHNILARPIGSKTFSLYGLAHASVNGWINHEESPLEKAQFLNWGFEGGAGITTSDCLRPFAEYRYNIKWRESSVRAGVIYTINCNSKGSLPCSMITKGSVHKTKKSISKNIYKKDTNIKKKKDPDARKK